MTRRVTTIVLVAALASAASCSTKHSPAIAPPSVSALGARDTHENLHSVLWIQTSIEYEIAAEGAYARAIDLLESGLKRAQADPTWSAAIEQHGDLAHLQPAIVMDVDETVLDNRRFQGQQVINRTWKFDPALWSQWVGLAQAPAVPGAVAFVKHAQAIGVRIFFITNRTATEEPDTIKNLRQTIGLFVGPDDVLSVGDKDATGQPWSGTRVDKTYRRSFVAATHRIILLIGDDLTDFISAERKTPAERRQLAESHKAYWRDRWVMLLNPIYGSWESALYADLQDASDSQRLARKRSLIEGFPLQ